MEQFIAAAVTELLKYGLPGLAMAYLIYENRQLKADVEAKAQHIEQLQEKRVNEAIKTVMTLGANAASSEKMAERR